MMLPVIRYLFFLGIYTVIEIYYYYTLVLYYKFYLFATNETKILTYHYTELKLIEIKKNRVSYCKISFYNKKSKKEHLEFSPQ